MRFPTNTGVSPSVDLWLGRIAAPLAAEFPGYEFNKKTVQASIDHLAGGLRVEVKLGAHLIRANALEGTATPPENVARELIEQGRRFFWPQRQARRTRAFRAKHRALMAQRRLVR